MDQREPDVASSLYAPSISDDQFMAAYLRGRDEACPLCGYNLRGLTLPRCPECGNLLKLSVGLAEPFVAAWIVCAAVTCLSAGLGLFITVVLLMGKGSPHLPSLLQVISFYSFVGMIPVAAIVLIHRRWFMRRSRQIQRYLAALAVVAVFLQFAAITLWM